MRLSSLPVFMLGLATGIGSANATWSIVAVAVCTLGAGLGCIVLYVAYLLSLSADAARPTSPPNADQQPPKPTADTLKRRMRLLRSGDPSMARIVSAVRKQPMQLLNSIPLLWEHRTLLATHFDDLFPHIEELIELLPALSKHIQTLALPEVFNPLMRRIDVILSLRNELLPHLNTLMEPDVLDVLLRNIDIILKYRDVLIPKADQLLKRDLIDIALRHEKLLIENIDELMAIADFLLVNRTIIIENEEAIMKVVKQLETRPSRTWRGAKASTLGLSQGRERPTTSGHRKDSAASVNIDMSSNSPKTTPRQTCDTPLKRALRTIERYQGAIHPRVDQILPQMDELGDIIAILMDSDNSLVTALFERIDQWWPSFDLLKAHLNDAKVLLPRLNDLFPFIEPHLDLLLSPDILQVIVRNIPLISRHSDKLLQIDVLDTLLKPQIVRLITNNPDIVEKYGDIVVEYIDSLTDPDVTNLILEKGDTIVPHIDAIVPLLPLIISVRQVIVEHADALCEQVDRLDSSVLEQLSEVVVPHIDDLRPQMQIVCRLAPEVGGHLPELMKHPRVVHGLLDHLRDIAPFLPDLLSKKDDLLPHLPLVEKHFDDQIAPYLDVTLENIHYIVPKHVDAVIPLLPKVIPKAGKILQHADKFFPLADQFVPCAPELVDAGILDVDVEDLLPYLNNLLLFYFLTCEHQLAPYAQELTPYAHDLVPQLHQLVPLMPYISTHIEQLLPILSKTANKVDLLVNYCGWAITRYHGVLDNPRVQAALPIIGDLLPSLGGSNENELEKAKKEIARLKEANEAHQSQNAVLEKDLFRKTKLLKAAEFGVTDLGRQLNAAKNALAVAKAEFLKKAADTVLMEEFRRLKERHFMHLAVNAKLEHARDGKPTNIDAAALFEEAENEVAVENWDTFIRDAIEANRGSESSPSMQRIHSLPAINRRNTAGVTLKEGTRQRVQPSSSWNPSSPSAPRAHPSISSPSTTRGNLQRMQSTPVLHYQSSPKPSSKK